MYYISSERAKPTSYRIGNNPLKLKRPAKRSRQQLGHLNLLLSWNLRSASRHLRKEFRHKPTTEELKTAGPKLKTNKAPGKGKSYQDSMANNPEYLLGVCNALVAGEKFWILINKGSKPIQNPICFLDIEGKLILSCTAIMLDVHLLTITASYPSNRRIVLQAEGVMNTMNVSSGVKEAFLNSTATVQSLFTGAGES
ncbi:hypothetical protein QE152_g869 [Popillia japonica]|uniref:Uncharacterized protein n=1 Tax=Popillia japonica TaxID=7064 RepID=A0AAW1NDQ8_POPJA